MNLRTLFVWSAVLIITSFMACEEPTGPSGPLAGEAVVAGSVLQENSFPVVGATVLLSSALGSQSTSSDSLGRYTLTLNFDSLQASVSAKIEVIKLGFKRDSTSLFLAPGNFITGLDFILRPDTGAAAIFGGIPDKDHFFTFWETLGPFLNVPAGSDAKLQARVGDRLSNPVSGAVVSFSTTLGIVTAQAITDKDGLGSAVLSTAGELGRGSGQVFASTTGDGGATIQDTLSFLLSGEPVIQVTGNPNNFLITDNGFATFTYQVSDAAGNPLAKGSTINVGLDGTAASLVDLDGDFEVTIPNTSDATTWTNFAFSIRDPDVAVTNASGTLVVTIRVSGPNGDQQYSFRGGFQGTGGPPPGGSGDAASFVLVSLSPSEISVRGVGGIETATIVFEARDDQGRPVDTEHSINVTFAVLSGPGGGEFITPASALTDAAGRARASINSGTISGPMQIQAQAVVGVTTVRSTPVQLAIASGLPDQAHFSVATQRLNFWGWDFLNNRMGAVVLVGDKYSNPVKQGTVVSFQTDGNIVAGDNLADATGGSSLTDGSGIAVATIISGNPKPRVAGFGRDGYGYLKARTVGLPAGPLPVVVKDSALYVTTSDVALVNVSPTTFTISAGGAQAFTITVEDVNGNPIMGGSTVSITTAYVAPEGSDISIVIDPGFIKIPDSLTPGSGTTTFTFRVLDSTAGGTPTPQQFPVTVRVTHIQTTTELIFSIAGTVGG